MNGKALAALLSIALGATGCANVHVHKVSVAKRIAGRDHHVKGFRYYTSRPYVVVSQAVDVATDSTLTRLVHIEVRDKTKVPDPPAFALQSLIRSRGQPDLPLFDLQGRPMDPNLFKAGPPVSIASISNPNLFPDPTSQPTPAPREGGPSPLVAPPPPAPFGASGFGSRGATLDARTAARLLSSATKDNAVQRTQAPENGLNLAPGIPLAPETVAVAKEPPKPDAVLKDATEPAQFQVVFLPDFEEQFAIRNRNLLAKSQYNYHFTDGWSLDNVSGTWNATDVPVRFLQTLGNIFGHAASFEQDRMKAEKMPAAGTPLAGALDLVPARNEVRFEVRRVLRIEPGIYRIQKSWERVAAAPPPAEMPPDLASSLLSDLGLPVVETIQVVKSNQAHP
jgi:hypothetical protein